MWTATSIHMHIEETKSCSSVLHYALLYSISGWSHIAGFFCHLHCATTEACGKFLSNWWHGKLPCFRIGRRAFSSLWSWDRNQCPKITHETGRQLWAEICTQVISQLGKNGKMEGLGSACATKGLTATSRLFFGVWNMAIKGHISLHSLYIYFFFLN